MINMNPATVFYFLSVCLISKSTLCADVNDLKPDVDCPAVLAKGVDDRAKDPTLMNKISTSNQDYTKATSIYDFVVKDTYMKESTLGDYCKGKVTLIVNIGSSCGLTAPNYAQLTNIYKEFGDQIRICAFPCNQFMDQMPEGDGDEMLCHLKKMNAEIGNIFAKVDVNGDNTTPLYKYLKDQIKGQKGPDIEWNFAKFLIDKNGKPVKRYEPTFEPKDMVEDIKKLL